VITTPSGTFLQRVKVKMGRVSASVGENRLTEDRKKRIKREAERRMGPPKFTLRKGKKKVAKT